LPSLDSVQRLLNRRGYSGLARLLKGAELDFDVSTTYGTYLYSQLTTAIISAPIEEYDRLQNLSTGEKDQILKTLLEIYPPGPHEMEIDEIVFRLNPATLTNKISDAELLQEIDNQKSLMISVATGGPKINSVNEQYKEREQLIRTALDERGLDDPNPYVDLWGWYGKWSSGDFPKYQSRRDYISELYSPLIDKVKSGLLSDGTRIFEEPTGWTKVDRQLREAIKQLKSASGEEHFQAVGLLCRETLISLGQTIYDPARHPSTDDVIPSPTDGKRMIEGYLAVELSGDTNKYARTHAKAALDFAVALQHKRTANFLQAALCAEATASIVNLIAIISGRRDP
jgi:hypothetical protein